MRLPWIEEFRPGDINSMILPPTYKAAFKSYIAVGSIPNMILYSNTPGPGKTSCAKALTRDLGAEYKLINASLQRGIDTIRDEVEDFAQFESLSGVHRVVILDEFDGSSSAMQNALKSFLELYTESCRFIITCNSFTSIIEPLRSRCKCYDFNFNNDEFRDHMKLGVGKRLVSILKKKGVSFDNDAVIELVNAHFPDIRSVIQVAEQAFDLHGRIGAGAVSLAKGVNDIVAAVFSGDSRTARVLMMRDGNYRNIYTELMRCAPDHIMDKADFMIVPIISDFMWRESTGVIDSDINFYHMAIEIQKLKLKGIL